ncbi:hypothetical protein BD309DRAFT_874100 [Dichomitus squalens]|uniref:DUF6534 domain-containing protein n=1 Tax=Dichomitus squalens TaxID=114155 RepID=A0A4Q9NCA0_9APHY|nr:hypothetical protein BD309DRAFT_874100 [Dichomitus squalens]TBU51547.1 hypothetical protein BD310DRAFT_834085 [Dichomitus squalens]
MGADLTITGSLVYILGHFRTGFKRTDARLDLLIAYALSTGLFTCLFHVLNVIASAVWQRNLIWMVPTSVLFKLYANNFLVALNSRKALGIMGDEDERTSHSSHNQHNMGKTADSSRNRGIDGRAAQTAPVQLRIMQHTTSETHMDSVDLETKSKGSPDDVVHIV